VCQRGDVVLQEGGSCDALYVVIGGAVASHRRPRRRSGGAGAGAASSALEAPLLLDEECDAEEGEASGDGLGPQAGA